MKDIHLPVMSQETLDGWFTKADGIYIDGTFGRGGHSQMLLQRLGSKGKLLVVDRDPEAIAAARQLQGKYAQLEVQHGDFASLSQCVEQRGWQGRVTGLLLDLGVSSPQLDDAERGFSFMRNGPLDMRMDPTQGISAAEWLATAETQEIARVLWEYGEEKFSRRIARAIEQRRSADPIMTTQQLVSVIESAVPAKDQGKHKATRSFQAIRIFINSELEQLKRLLNCCIEWLEPAGRLAVISFHSLEDRIVKRYMRDMARGESLPASIPLKDCELNRQLGIVVRSRRAGEQEMMENPRSRSAILRVAEKL